jgi:drug/metabolite transporter (DMT)-like permease
MFTLDPRIVPRSRTPGGELLLLLTLSALWGSSFTFIRIGVATIPPLTLIAARTVIAGSLLGAWLAARHIALPREPAVWRRFLVQALLNSVLPFTLIAWAEQSVEAGLATILNSTSPVLTFLASGSSRGTKWSRHAGCSASSSAWRASAIVGSSVLRGLESSWCQLAIIVATVCYAGAAIYVARSANYRQSFRRPDRRSWARRC